MIICNCFCVRENDIKKSIQEGCRTVDEIAEKTFASSGCGICQEEVQRILDEALQDIKI